ncbi:MAG: hypothetical protein MUC65_05985, partial [Pontiellaceae bacterium]|nr:hypothetical protein [Pontiellaceae bacterium]
GLVTVTNGTVGDFNDIGYVIPTNGSSLYVRIKSTRPAESLNDGWFELVPTAGTDHTELIQTTLDKLHEGATLKLVGNFFIAGTIYLPSNFKWILEGSFSLADNAILDIIGWYGGGARPTGITEKPDGAGNIDMSGGTYNGNFVNNPTTLRFINFIWVTNSYFHDMVITNVSDDNFTLGSECNNNLCRNIRSAFSITGNALTDKGDHNKWFDCIAEDCLGNDGDGWTPKCRYSEFYRCIGRRNGGPGFGLYCRDENEPYIGLSIDGNKFFSCESYENWGGGGFSFNIPSNGGYGASMQSNYVEAICYSNNESGVMFRNKLTDSIVADNVINLLCWGNRGLGGLATDGGIGRTITGITGTIVSFGNSSYDVNLQHASNCTITVYRPLNKSVPGINYGSSNTITVTNVSAAGPSDPWCVHAYYNATNIP